MTVQAGIEVDVDLAALVGEMPTVPCEHAGHEYDLIYHDKGDATHYVHGACKCGRDKVFAVCLSFANIIKCDAELRCGQCNVYMPASFFLTILGPIK